MFKTLNSDKHQFRSDLENDIQNMNLKMKWEKLTQADLEKAALWIKLTKCAHGYLDNHDFKELSPTRETVNRRKRRRNKWSGMSCGKGRK